jgi:hypothetical protein
VRIRIALLVVSVLITACEGRIVVPLRLCAVKGSSLTQVPEILWPSPESFPPLEGGYFYSEGTLFSDMVLDGLVQRANAVWNSAANIGFLAIQYPGGNGHYPIIDDPRPPGGFDSMGIWGPGQYGDLKQFEMTGPGGEVRDAAIFCDAAWRRGGGNIAPKAFVVVVARKLVGTAGLQGGVMGLTSPILDLKNRNAGADLCTVPRKLSTADFIGRYSVIVDPQLFGIGQALAGDGDAGLVLAHELGHLLLLAHGDGLDNDNNGTLPPADGARRFDEDCDIFEYNTIDAVPGHRGSLMSVDNASLTNLTPLQRELARTAATLAAGAVGP